MKKFYWYTFADGYRFCAGKLSAHEKNVEVAKHGNLLSIIPA